MEVGADASLVHCTVNVFDDSWPMLCPTVSAIRSDYCVTPDCVSSVVVPSVYLIKSECDVECEDAESWYYDVGA